MGMHRQRGSHPKEWNSASRCSNGQAHGSITAQQYLPDESMTHQVVVSRFAKEDGITTNSSIKIGSFLFDVKPCESVNKKFFCASVISYNKIFGGANLREKVEGRKELAADCGHQNNISDLWSRLIMRQ